MRENERIGERKRDVLLLLVKNLALHGILRATTPVRLAYAFVRRDWARVWAIVEEVLYALHHYNSARHTYIREEYIEEQRRQYELGEVPSASLQESLWSFIESLSQNILY